MEEDMVDMAESQLPTPVPDIRTEAVDQRGNPSPVLMEDDLWCLDENVNQDVHTSVEVDQDMHAAGLEGDLDNLDVNMDLEEHLRVLDVNMVENILDMNFLDQLSSDDPDLGLDGVTDMESYLGMSSQNSNNIEIQTEQRSQVSHESGNPAKPSQNSSDPTSPEAEKRIPTYIKKIEYRRQNFSGSRRSKDP